MTFRLARGVTPAGRGTFKIAESSAVLGESPLKETTGRKRHAKRGVNQRCLPGTVVAPVQSGARAWSLSLITREGKGIMINAHLKRLGVAIVFVAMLALVFLVSGAAQSDVKFTDAASYYKDAKCVVCHGQKAEKKFNAELKDEELVEIVLRGKKPEKPPNMPAYEAKGLTAEQAKAMVDYMKSLKQ
jgi:mono/diheme cytochrome c family protein